MNTIERLNTKTFKELIDDEKWIAGTKIENLCFFYVVDDLKLRDILVN